MSLYEISDRTPAAAAAAAYATIHTGASYRAKIREIGAFASAGTASSIGLIRPSNTPVATTSKAGLPEDTGDPAGTVNLDTAWSTAPTIGTSFLRRISLPGNAGAGIIWTWPLGEGLVVAVSSWVVLWNFGAGAGAALDVYVVWEE